MNSKKNEQRGFGRFIGTSGAMQAIYEKISKIAPTNAPVFIKGESGTGKEICAQMIHAYSDRHAQPFIGGFILPPTRHRHHYARLAAA